jgi:hypothetical protein
MGSMTFFDEATEVLSELWETADAPSSSIPSEIVEDISILLGDKGGQSYPYALLTQVLGATTDPNLDPKSIQRSSKDTHGIAEHAAWDARSLAHKVVVPWNQSVEYPLGTANEPYVNKPLRYPYFDDQMRSGQKYKDPFDALVRVLDFCSGNADLRFELLTAILCGAKKRLEQTRVTFAPPLRIAPDRLREMVARFLDERSLGLRLQIITAALFRAQSEGKAGVVVETDNSTVADAASKSGADVRVVKDSQVQLLAEVKDRDISAADITSSIRKARGVEASELKIVYVPAARTPTELYDLAAREFSNGMTVTLVPWNHLFDSFLNVSNESARSLFLRSVGDLLNEVSAPHQHKIAWRDLLLS